MQVVDLAQFSGNDADYIDDITGDGGVLKDVLKPGAGDELGPYPPVPSRVKVRHTTTVDDAARTRASKKRSSRGPLSTDESARARQEVEAVYTEAGRPRRRGDRVVKWVPFYLCRVVSVFFGVYLRRGRARSSGSC